MCNSIFYKEWIKSRKILLLLSIVFTGMIAYLFMSISQDFRVSGAVSVWGNVITKDMPLVSLLKWLPLASGILLALAQFTPEMQNKRLKLTLHLPLSETSIITCMLLYGIVVMLVLLACTSLIVLWGLNLYFAREIIVATCWVAAPWLLAGPIAYLFTSWICIEPVWIRRILYAFTGICGLSFCFITAHSGAYSPFIPYLLAWTIISFAFPFYSAIRFKEGKQ